VRGTRIEMRTARAARAVKMRSFADLKLNTHCATLGGMAITTKSGLLHRALTRRRGVRSADTHSTASALPTTTRTPFLIATQVRIEFTLTHSKQTVGADSNRNKFRGYREPSQNQRLTLSATCRFLIANRRLESLATHSKQSAAPCSNREQTTITNHEGV
jgi:hypothetical protein